VPAEQLARLLEKLPIRRQVSAWDEPLALCACDAPKTAALWPSISNGRHLTRESPLPWLSGERVKTLCGSGRGHSRLRELLVAALPRDVTNNRVWPAHLPEMDLASVACAIQNYVAGPPGPRACGLGLGFSLFWISARRLAQLLGHGPGRGPNRCGFVSAPGFECFYAEPMLVEQGWSHPRPLFRNSIY